MTATNEEGVALIKEFEGLRLQAYRDPVGIWTIGYGHTRTAQPGMTITEAEADRLLRQDLRDAETAVADLIAVPLNGNQHAALVSFVFNVGAGALANSTLRRLLNGGDYAAVPAQLARWNKGTANSQKIVLTGLTRRREAEGALWGQPVAVAPAPRPAPGGFWTVLARALAAIFRRKPA